MAKRITKKAGLEFIEYDTWEESAKASGLTDDDIFLINYKELLKKSIEAELEKRKMTRKALAELMETPQPQITAVLNGKKPLTIDYAFKMLLKLGYKPEFPKVKKAA